MSGRQPPDAERPGRRTPDVQTSAATTQHGIASSVHPKVLEVLRGVDARLDRGVIPTFLARWHDDGWRGDDIDWSIARALLIVQRDLRLALDQLENRVA